MEVPNNLAEAIELYAHSTPVITPHIIANLKSTLKMFVLPGFNFSPKALADVNSCYRKLLIKTFLVEAQQHFDLRHQQAKQEGKNHGTLKNHLCGFNRFMRFLKAQDWYEELVEFVDLPRNAPKFQTGIGIQKLHKGRSCTHVHRYVLKKEELTPKLAAQIKTLHNFLTADYLPSRMTAKSVSKATWDSYERYILGYFGWLKNEMVFNLADLDLTILIDLPTLKEYISWHLNEKKNSYRTPMGACCAALNVAKCFGRREDGSPAKLSDYSDISVVNDIRTEINKLVDFGKGKRRTSSKEALAEKLVTMEQCQEIVEHLRHRCSGRDAYGGIRTKEAICKSWQDYLIIAILTYTPVRQREIREMEIGKNLIREEDGWWVRLTPEGHKTGRKTGKGREYPLFAGPKQRQLTQDMDNYIQKIRPQVKLRVKDTHGNISEGSHSFLFFGRGSAQYKESQGLPLVDNRIHLTQLIPRLMTSTTAYLYGAENVKCTSAHDFRRIFASWLVKFGTREDMELYAEIMGTSVRQLLDTYSQVESKEKTERADEAFNRVAARQRAYMKSKDSTEKKNFRTSSKVSVIRSLWSDLTESEQKQFLEEIDQM